MKCKYKHTKVHSIRGILKRQTKAYFSYHIRYIMEKRLEIPNGWVIEGKTIQGQTKWVE